jgi:secondary thiamine-phosphate synthase enzyme
MFFLLLKGWDFLAHRLTVRTPSRNAFVDITRFVQDFVSASGFIDCTVSIFCPHTTCAVTINENSDPDVVSDALNFLSAMVPKNGSFSHSEGNSDAHIKTMLFGNSVSVFVEDGKLLLGTWQAIYLAEFDGPRERQIWLKITK